MHVRNSGSAMVAVMLLAITRWLGAADPAAPQADDPDVLLWLDAADRATVNVDPSGFVSEWTSKAQRVRSTVTAEGQQRPQFIADAWEGKPALRFDGQDDVLHNVQFDQQANTWTLLLVVAPRSNKGNGIPDGFRCFLSANDHGKRDYVTGLNIDMGSRQTDRFLWLNVESNKAGGESNLLLVGADFGRPRVLAVCADADQIRLFAEGAPQAARSANSAATSFAELHLGARCYLDGRETGFVDADIAEVVLYGRALSLEAIQTLSQYLQDKYAVKGVPTVEPPTSLPEALAALGAYQWGQSRLFLVPIDDIIRHGDRAARESLEQQFCALLRPETSPAAVDLICRRLEQIGTATCVPALKALLVDFQRGGSVIYALQRIPAPEAGQALLESLASADQSLRVAVIQALGARREAGAAQALVPMLQSDQPAVPAAAAAVLGQIGDPSTVDAVLAAPSVSPHDLLTLAHALTTAGHFAGAQRVYAQLAPISDPAVRAAVLAGRVRLTPSDAADQLLAALRGDNARLRGQAAQLLSHECSESVVAAVRAELPRLSVEAQRTLLGMCWLQCPSAGRQLALQSLALDAPDVRSDALRLLADVGEPPDVATLAHVAVDDPNPQVRASAESALRHLAAAGIDDAINDGLLMLPVKERGVLIRAVGDRHTLSAAPILLQLAVLPDRETRIAALTATQQLGDAAAVPQLIACLLTADSADEQAAAERAVWLCAQRNARSAEPAAPVMDVYERADADQRMRLLPVLGRLGGARAAETLNAALADSRGDVRAAAVRGLANWPDAAVAGQLLRLAREADEPAHRIWALRGYVRVVTLPDARGAQQTVKLLQDAWQLATRDEERNLILQRLPAVVCTASLDMAVGKMRDPKLQTQAVAAAAQLAEALLPTEPQAAREAIKKILEADVDPALRTRLGRHLSSDR
jgi:HEAT repeat protein